MRKKNRGEKILISAITRFIADKTQNADASRWYSIFFLMRKFPGIDFMKELFKAWL